MQLILDTLEAARLTASPSDAMTLADAIADLEALADALTRNGWGLGDAASAMDALKDIRDHVASMPFETTDMDDGTTVVESLTPDAFAEWLATLERLAS
jgi:hypothetical protein